MHMCRVFNWYHDILYMVAQGQYTEARAHKNGRLEEERVTLIEACSPVKIIELYQK